LNVSEKARELHIEMNIKQKFVASDGWLAHWKHKYNIRQYSVCGEKLSSDTCETDVFKNNFQKIIEKENLHLYQIFNADETGVNFKMMPKKTLTEKSQAAPVGIKQNKDRVTVMVCSNADGSLKLPLFVIGKSAKPRAIKDISKSLLPVYYTHQKSAWMSNAIFEEWFEKKFVPCVTKFLKEKGGPIKAILLLDNAPSHPNVDSFVVGDIRVEYHQTQPQ